MTRSIAILATLHLGCFLGDCYEARSRPITLAEDSVTVPAPLESGTNAIRVACSIHVDALVREQLQGSIQWGSVDFVNTQAVDIAGRFTLGDADPVTLVSERFDDGTGPIRLAIGTGIVDPPCGESCDLMLELVVRTSPSGTLVAETVDGFIVLAMGADGDPRLDASTAIVDIACDPVEHLTIP